jgi:glutamine synthetase
MRTKVEYVWLDGYEPEPNLRSKIRIIDTNNRILIPSDISSWNFDGSSTMQAEGSNSDCILKPVRVYSNTQSSKVYVFCEVMKPDGTPHETNDRNSIGSEDYDLWFGFEQEYFIREGKNKPVLGHSNGSVELQGKYYCGVGSNVVGRDMVEEHLDMCLDYGIDITGVNAEVALGQWEYQVFSKGKLKACDDLWMARYFMEKISEKYGYHIEYHPKPLQHGEWNGSGLHTNFSTEKMRNGEINMTLHEREEYFKCIFKSLEIRHLEHIKNYGSQNNLRLTGKYETQSIDKFSWGISDRGASIRIPPSTSEKWTGYVEDRRPSSNANPYKVVKMIVDSLSMADELNRTLYNMSSNVNTKNFDIIREKYNGIPTSQELLDEYRNDGDYELSNDMMESKANVKPEELNLIENYLNNVKNEFKGNKIPEEIKEKMLNTK